MSNMNDPITKAINDRIDGIINKVNLASEGYQEIPEIRQTRDKAIELVRE
jgi:hypothetical protein